MRTELTGRHLDITPALRRLVDSKLTKLERVLNDSAVSAQAVLTREKHRHRVDVTIHARGEKFLHAVGDTGSWETSLTAVVEKLTQQVKKMKGKWQERKRRAGRAEAGAPREAAAPGRETKAPAGRARMPRVLDTTRQRVKTMSVEDAARAVDGSADGVVVFRDASTSTISVLCKRRGGELTLVETDAVA